ncbi:MAG TPA: tyrosine-type recombinase/integrase [Terriglobia bacterium]|nr:tyrosine-type recombinase/integrase [Terriglobia bacterium]
MDIKVSSPYFRLFLCCCVNLPMHLEECTLALSYRFCKFRKLCAEFHRWHKVAWFHVRQVHYQSHRYSGSLPQAGVPEQDARGSITSHRARSTIATQLYNAKQPMSLFALKEWLGHQRLESTQWYAKVTPDKLTEAYLDARYFERNVAVVQVLLDRAAIETGAAAKGEAYKYVHFGHGYCANPYWAQCVHRMACQRCEFYMPGDSANAQALEC